MYKYRTHANRPRSVYSIFHFFCLWTCGLFKKSVYSRSRSIKLTFWPVDQLAVKERKLKEIWEINPEKQEPVELEKIPDLCELDNNELLIDDV